MLELKNSKTTYLGKALDGRDKFALDCFIGAVQMRELDGEWVDIKPRLIRKPTDDGWFVDKVPYHAEINDDGGRLFCPDKYQRSEYFGLPTIPLLSNLPKNLVSSPTKLDGEILPNRIVMPAYWGEIRIPFTNTAMRFEVLFNEAPPSAIFGQDSPKIIFNTDLAGLDILKLLSEKKGLGILRPRLVEVGEGLLEPKTKWLDWSYQNGQLELGFDLTGLRLPVLLKNTTIDAQVGAGGDDGEVWYTTCAQFRPTDTQPVPGYVKDWNTSVGSWARFTGISGLGGATIDLAQYKVYGAAPQAGTPLTKVRAEYAASPAAPTDCSDYVAKTRTSAGVDWDGQIPAGWNSLTITTVMQEIADNFDPSAIQILHDDDGSSHTENNFMKYWNYDGSTTEAPKLYIEYTAGGGATPRGWWSK